MKVEKLNGSLERRVLTGLIVDKGVLAKVAPRWTEQGLFRSDWSNLVASWCVSYYNKYSKAPGRHVTSLFESWAAESKDKETICSVSSFLSGLSDEFDARNGELNTDYTVDLAGRLFERVQLGNLASAINDCLESNKVSKARQLVNDYNPVELGAGAGIDVLRDKGAIMRAFEQKKDDHVLITYPGALGEFYGSELCRDNFITIEGVEKRGKTWELLELAWMGLMNRRKVAFFEIGDLSEAQIMRRFMIRAARKPLKPCTIKYPKAINTEDGIAKVDAEERVFKEALDWPEALEACDRVIKRVKSNQTLLKLSAVPNTSLAGIKSTLDQWDRQGWGTPDICLIDYGDLLDAPPGRHESSWEVINWNWREMRKLNLQLHCLLLTASQVGASAYKAHTLGKAHFSGSKLKRAHVTGTIGLNQTDGEKTDGVIRRNWIVLREAEHTESRCCYAAGCLAIASPCIVSSW